MSCVIRHRRYLHQHPELSMEEYNTSKYCKAFLKELGYQIKEIWHTGFVAELNLNKSRTIAFRAEMDGLPVQEETGYQYCSINEGVSHACGHDAHMAIILNLGERIIKNKTNINNNIKLLFQPSEEMFPGGAVSMINHGALKNVDEIYGLHNNPQIHTGKIKCPLGNVTANCDILECSIIGECGHAASPHSALDPISITTNLINQIQFLPIKYINPMHNVLINITNVNSGNNAVGVIPNSASFKGIIRTFNAQDRILIKKKISQLVSATELQGYQTNLHIKQGYPSIYNKKYGHDRVIKAVEKIKSITIESKNNPELWGEDFSYYLNYIDGAFFILGSGYSNTVNAPLHSSKYKLDENCLELGVDIFYQIALE